MQHTDTQLHIIHSYTNSNLASSDLCVCGQQQTMNHTVNECPFTKFRGGLHSLHEVGDDAIHWLESTAATALIHWLESTAATALAKWKFLVRHSVLTLLFWYQERQITAPTQLKWWQTMKNRKLNIGCSCSMLTTPSSSTITVCLSVVLTCVVTLLCQTRPRLTKLDRISENRSEERLMSNKHCWVEGALYKA